MKDRDHDLNDGLITLSCHRQRKNLSLIGAYKRAAEFYKLRVRLWTHLDVCEARPNCRKKLVNYLAVECCFDFF